MKRLILAFAACTLALPTPGGAQATAVEALRRTVGSLGDSAHVQLMAPGVLVEDGYFLGLSVDSVRVASADAVITLGLDELEGLSVEGNRWQAGGVTGAAIGVVAGAMAGYFLGYGKCGMQFEGCDEHAWRVALRWGMVFGVGGGVAGGVVGSRLRRWQSVFP
jgi:hypothetical protein